MNSSSLSETLVACLTPPGTAALATLALCGPDAWTVAREVFQPRALPGAALPPDAEIGRPWFGRMAGEVGDEAVLTLKQHVPYPRVEIHCHGGLQVVGALLALLRDRGLRLCTWQELQRRTTADPLQAEAAIALSQARTTRTAAILLDQYHGALTRAVDALCTVVRQGDLKQAGTLLGDLHRHAALGLHLVEPWRVVIAGAPNVGKSSLVNAVAGFQRSIVSAIPGTTRDVVSTVLALDGWPVEIVDTAGLRSETAVLEQVGIDRARAMIAGADLCLWVLDASAGPAWPDSPTPSLRRVVNKVDLPAAWDLSLAAGSLHVSARTGAGVDVLCHAISTWLVPQPPAPGSAVPFTPQICEAVTVAHRACQTGNSEGALHALLPLRRSS